jgi:class 3 adenylate cyclase
MAFTRLVSSGASEDRLEKLIEERLQPGAAKEAIDRRIWDLFGEEWAVLYTDLSGFSRNTAEFGIIHFLQVIHESKKVLIPVIERHDGILLKTEGDSMLIIFRNPVRALECAVAMQAACLEYDRTRSDPEKLLLCVGIGLGRVLRISDTDVFGAEVNAACKLGEDTAKSWEILVTEPVRDAVPGWKFEKLGEWPAGTTGAYRLLYDRAGGLTR